MPVAQQYEPTPELVVLQCVARRDAAMEAAMKTRQDILGAKLLRTFADHARVAAELVELRDATIAAIVAVAQWRRNLCYRETWPPGGKDNYLVEMVKEGDCLNRLGDLFGFQLPHKCPLVLPAALPDGRHVADPLDPLAKPAEGAEEDDPESRAALHRSLRRLGVFSEREFAQAKACSAYLAQEYQKWHGEAFDPRTEWGFDVFARRPWQPPPLRRRPKTPPAAAAAAAKSRRRRRPRAAPEPPGLPPRYDRPLVERFGPAMAARMRTVPTTHLAKESIEAVWDRALDRSKKTERLDDIQAVRAMRIRKERELPHMLKPRADMLSMPQLPIIDAHSEPPVGALFPVHHPIAMPDGSVTVPRIGARRAPPKPPPARTAALERRSTPPVRTAALASSLMLSIEGLEGDEAAEEGVDEALVTVKVKAAAPPPRPLSGRSLRSASGDVTIDILAEVGAGSGSGGAPIC